MKRVAHLSTGHNRRDVRVYLKECISLTKAGYEVHYVVADGLGHELVDGVHVHDAGIAGGRFRRMLLRPWRILKIARTLDASLFHFHDPELLTIAFFLKWGGARVIYDSHEDVPRSLLSRNWLPKWTRSTVAFVFERFENFISRRLSAIVTATPHIALRFSKLNPLTVAINNFPLPSEIENPIHRKGVGRTVCYLGGISRVRGIEEMILALDYVDVRLIIAGWFDSEETEAAMKMLPSWDKVDYRGLVSRAEARTIMAESAAGLVFFHPEPNHTNAQPNKIFEYMSSGLPVLASDFPLWRQLLTDANAGLVANPMFPKAIAAVIEQLFNDPAAASKMGASGRAFVLKQLIWTSEAKKLVYLYKQLLDAK